MKTIGESMREARLKKSLSAGQLQQMSGVLVQTIYNYERNITYPTALNLVSIADALDISLDELVGRVRK